MRPCVARAVALLYLAPLCALGIATGCSGGSSASAASAPSPSPAPVRTVVAVRSTLQPALTIPGTIAPLQTVALSNALSEPAAAVYVREGDRVSVGQALADLNVDDLQASFAAAQRTARANSARAAESRFTAQLAFAQYPGQVQQARAQVVQAQQTLNEAFRNLDRDAVLAQQGYLPQQNLDEQRVVVRNDQQAELQSQSQLTVANAAVRANGNGQSGLQASTIAAAREDAAAQAATAEQIRRQIERAHITSPVDGVVINRNLNPGEYPAGRQIFTLEANDTMYAVLTASAVQAYAIAAGDRVVVGVPGVPGAQFAGRVEALLDAATPGSTNFAVKVAIPNPAHVLRAGTPVHATVDLRPVRGIVIPSSAFTNDTRTRVLAVQNGRARVRQVGEVTTDGANSVVNGLPAGVRIVRDGSIGLAEGDTVTVVR